jgi:hypothetical protein
LLHHISEERLRTLAARFCAGNRPYQREEAMLKISRVLAEREPKYLTYFELVRIAAFVDASLAAYASANEPNILKHTTEEAFALPPEKALRKLLSLSGVDVRVASFVLSLLEPEVLPFLNHFAWVALFSTPKLRFTPEDYSRYREEVAKLRKGRRISAYEVSKALTVLGMER